VTPSLLIASPLLADPNFTRTVILLWHYDDEGAIGVILNRNVDEPIQELLEDKLVDAYTPHLLNRVSWGGPVEQQAGTAITRGHVSDEEGWNLPCGISVTRSAEALARLLRGGDPVVLCLGYAGWAPGQLEEELEAGSWLYLDLDATMVFVDADLTDTLYERALAALGLDESAFWGPSIGE